MLPLVRAALFVTCLADRFFAEAAADSVRLLRRLGVDVEFPASQTCCGQPAFNAGARDEAARMARTTVQALGGAEFVVVPSGSCAAMLRCHFPELLGPEAERLARVTYELTEFIVDVLGVEQLGPGLEGRRIAYHHGCHALRELGVCSQPIRLLEGAGAEVIPWDAASECCGFGGLFAVKMADVSVAMTDRKLDTLPDVDCLVSGDPGCLLQLASRARARGLNRRVSHLAPLLLEALRGRP